MLAVGKIKNIDYLFVCGYNLQYTCICFNYNFTNAHWYRSCYRIDFHDLQIHLLSNFYSRVFNFSHTTYLSHNPYSSFLIPLGTANTITNIPAMVSIILTVV